MLQNPPRPVRPWHRLLHRRLTRRDAIRGVLGAAGAAALPLAMQSPANRVVRAGDVTAGGAALPFKPIRPSTADELVLPEGFSYHVVRAYGEDVGGGQTFGYNNDFIAFLPIDLLDGGESSADGLLVVNHEYPNPLLQHGNADGTKTAEQVDVERKSLGVTVMRVRRGDGGAWAVVPDGRNRRVDGYSECELTGPVRGAGAVGGAVRVRGTVGNCSGGVTPWGTVLSCEENVDEYAEPVEGKGYGWGEGFCRSHYGWVVEVDPFDPRSMPKKRTAMGRMRHENVAVRVAPDGRVVAYMGDDKIDSCVFKFVSRGRLNSADRSSNLDLLGDGELYAADFSRGRWLLLDYAKQKGLRDATRKDDGGRLFAGQADVLADARAAALALKATPVDRPEDVEVHPVTGDVYIALTNNAPHGNFHGQIVRLREDGNDPAGTSFEWELFAAGGRQSGFSSPDNLVFDPAGNLWMVTDVSSERLKAPKSSDDDGGRIYRFQGNNSMFFFRTEGPEAGKAYPFASGPVECELCGPCWTPDGTTLFLSVQHPGEETSDRANPTSRWPNGKGPLPAVVAITGFAKFDRPSRPFHGGTWAVGGAVAGENTRVEDGG